MARRGPGGVVRHRELRVSVAAKLTMAVAVVCALLVGVGVVVVNQLGHAQTRMQRLYEQNLRAGRDLDVVAINYSLVLYEVDNLFVATTDADQQAALLLITSYNNRIDAAWRAYREGGAAGTKLDRAEFLTALNGYRQVLQEWLMPIIDRADSDNDSDTWIAVRKKMVDPRAATVQSSLERLQASIDADTRRALASSRQASGRARALTAGMVLAAVLLAVGLLLIALHQLRALRRNRTIVRTDALTGLANRLLFREALPLAAERAARSDALVAVLLLDLDGFKQINDTLGHDAGDEVLIHLARVLRDSVRAADTVVRMGGDEFAILAEDIGSAREAIGLAECILDNLRPAVAVAGHQVNIRASIGLALHAFPTGADTAAERELLHQADLAMYASKRSQSHGWQLYADGGMETDWDTVELREDLSRAVAGGQIRVHYQPIVRLADSEMVAVEALVRWQHPTRGLIPPGMFIPLAEETGLIHELGMHVLEQACRQVLRWQERLPLDRSLYVSVNVSGRQLERPDLAGDILTVVNRVGFDPASLLIEITETAFVEDGPALSHLHRLRGRGVRIAVDDFGTGYSSLRYLTRLPVDVLKLDRSFVAELNGRPEGSAVAEAIIRLAQILDLGTVAEGIEEEAQATELTLLGCRSGQGFYYAKPLSPEAFEETFVQHWPKLPARV